MVENANMIAKLFKFQFPCKCKSLLLMITDDDDYFLSFSFWACIYKSKKHRSGSCTLIPVVFTYFNSFNPLNFRMFVSLPHLLTVLN